MFNLTYKQNQEKKKMKAGLGGVRFWVWGQCGIKKEKNVYASEGVSAVTDSQTESRF